MFYKYWKKIALALAGLFWASCGDVEAPVNVEVNNLCYNDTAVNESGKVFKIIDCIDGNKYLRDPSVAGAEGVELPEGVQVFAPKAGSDKAPNCSENGDVCIERNPNISEELDSLAGCHPIIDCPEKPN